MKHFLIAALGVAIAGVMVDHAQAIDPNKQAQRFAQARTWHGGYVYWQYQQPTALVVPPTVSTQTRMGWGVAQTEINSLHHQYNRNYPHHSGDFGQFRRAPYWPSHTDQFGAYYIRGPWGHQ